MENRIWDWDLLTKRQKKEFHHMHLRNKKTFDKKTKKEVSSHAFTKQKTSLLWLIIDISLKIEKLNSKGGKETIFTWSRASTII
jgi:hypothetical protein